VVPQGYWYWGPLGVLGEYAVSSQKIRLTGAPATKVHNDAWQLTATCLLTGEENSYQGVRPHTPFSLANGGWGAWELAGRVGRLEIDNEAFPTLSLAGSASKATSWGTGVNWYLNRNLKLSLDYEQTYFKDGSSQRGTVTAQDEKLIFSRVQLAF
jgi:phosphate-selective porin OprO/OprP